MHAGFQDAVGLGDLRLRELFEREGGLHWELDFRFGFANSVQICQAS